jgi:hypothetical protein
MGFKLNYPLYGPGGSSLNGANVIALPYNAQSGINSSKTLMDDIGSDDVNNVQRYMTATNSFELYTGRTGTPNPDFPIAAGEAYFVTMGTTVNYIIVGSHQPSLAINLYGPGGSSLNGSNFFAYPYHHTQNTAKGLMDDIGSDDVNNVQRYMAATNSYELYTGRTGSPNADFPLAPGEGYFIVMGSTVSYTPSHY